VQRIKTARKEWLDGQERVEILVSQPPTDHLAELQLLESGGAN